MYYKIKNLIQSNGNADYKGLDINLFVPGKQVYDFEMNQCMIETTEEELISHSDLEVVNEGTYLYFRHEIKSKTEIDLYKEVEKLEKEKEQLNDKIDLALIELTTLISLGGMGNV